MVILNPKVAAITTNKLHLYQSQHNLHHHNQDQYPPLILISFYAQVGGVCVGVGWQRGGVC